MGFNKIKLINSKNKEIINFLGTYLNFEIRLQYYYHY